MHGIYNEERKKDGLVPVYYKMAANNPRNPVNKADDLEARLIRYFNTNRNIKEYQEVVTVKNKKYLYYAIPFLKNQLHAGYTRDANPSATVSGIAGDPDGDGLTFSIKTGVQNQDTPDEFTNDDEIDSLGDDLCT